MGDPLTLSSKEYACLRMLQVLAMVRKPVSDGVKAAMQAHTWPGSSWKKNAHSLWFDQCRRAGDFVLSQDGIWATSSCLIIMTKFMDVIIENAPADIQADDAKFSPSSSLSEARFKIQRSMTHVSELSRFWQVRFNPILIRF